MLSMGVAPCLAHVCPTPRQYPYKSPHYDGILVNFVDTLLTSLPNMHA